MPETNFNVIGKSFILVIFTLVFLGELNVISLHLLANSGPWALLVLQGGVLVIMENPQNALLNVSSTDYELLVTSCRLFLFIAGHPMQSNIKC